MIAISDEFDPGDPRDWPAIEHDFMHSGMSLRRIARKHGISAWCLTEHAKKRGWVRIVPTIPLPRGRPPNPPGAPKPAAAARRNQKLVKRLLAALDKGLRQLEARMSPEATPGAEPISAADAERDAKTLGGLTQILQKLIALEEKAKNVGNAGAGQETEATGHADAFRRDLALRLERLNQAREPR